METIKKVLLQLQSEYEKKAMNVGQKLQPSMDSERRVMMCAKTKEMLLAKFNPSTQAATLRHEDDMFVKRKRPTLFEVECVFGSEVSEDFIYIQLLDHFDRNAIQTAGDKHSIIKFVSASMAQRCSMWMLSEVVLFFAKLNNGDFGENAKTFSQSQFFAKIRIFYNFRFDKINEYIKKNDELIKEQKQEICKSVWDMMAINGKPDFEEFERECKKALKLKFCQENKY